MHRAIDRTFFEHLSCVARNASNEARAFPLAVHSKAVAGFDPVTNADTAIEIALRAALQNAFPEDGLRGEELEDVRPEAPRCWSIDPIDGTRAFICGLPSWSVLVGVTEDGQHVAGMIDMPATGEVYIAVHGQTTCNGLVVQTSGQTLIEQTRLSTTDPFLFSGSEFDAFDRVRRSSLFTRYGLDGSAYARLAGGGLDLIVESGLKPHDYDALIPVVRGAGGHIGDWAGGDEFASGRIIAAATQTLYASAVEIMKEAVE